MDMRLSCWLAGLVLGGAAAAGAAEPVTAPADEREAAQLWAERAFSAEAGPEPPAPWLWVRRQDHGAFNRNKSVMDTPLVG
jgi:hypothetical protein